jgi:hypothetical protein
MAAFPMRIAGGESIMLGNGGIYSIDSVYPFACLTKGSSLCFGPPVSTKLTAVVSSYFAFKFPDRCSNRITHDRCMRF